MKYANYPVVGETKRGWLISLLVGFALFSLFIVWLASTAAAQAENNKELLHTPTEYFSVED